MDLAGIAVPEDVQYPSLAPALRNGVAIEPQPVFSEIDFGIWHYRLGDRCAPVRRDTLAHPHPHIQVR